MKLNLPKIMDKDNELFDVVSGPVNIARTRYAEHKLSFIVDWKGYLMDLTLALNDFYFKNLPGNLEPGIRYEIKWDQRRYCFEFDIEIIVHEQPVMYMQYKISFEEVEKTRIPASDILTKALHHYLQQVKLMMIGIALKTSYKNKMDALSGKQQP